MTRIVELVHPVDDAQSFQRSPLSFEPISTASYIKPNVEPLGNSPTRARQDAPPTLHCSIRRGRQRQHRMDAREATLRTKKTKAARSLA